MPQATGPLRPSSLLLLLSVKVTTCIELVQGSSEKSTSHLSGTFFYLVYSGSISAVVMLKTVLILSKQPWTRPLNVTVRLAETDQYSCIKLDIVESIYTVKQVCGYNLFIQENATKWRTSTRKLENHQIIMDCKAQKYWVLLIHKLLKSAQTHSCCAEVGLCTGVIKILISDLICGCQKCPQNLLPLSKFILIPHA